MKDPRLRYMYKEYSVLICYYSTNLKLDRNEWNPTDNIQKSWGSLYRSKTVDAKCFVLGVDSMEFLYSEDFEMLLARLKQLTPSEIIGYCEIKDVEY